MLAVALTAAGTCPAATIKQSLQVGNRKSPKGNFWLAAIREIPHAAADTQPDMIALINTRLLIRIERARIKSLQRQTSDSFDFGHFLRLMLALFAIGTIVFSFIL